MLAEDIQLLRSINEERNANDRGGRIDDEETSRDTWSSHSLWSDIDEFNSPRDPQSHSIIQVLKNELQNREIPPYLDEFEVIIPDAEVVVGFVPIEEVQERELQIEQAKIRQAELESDLFTQRESHLARQELLARERLMQEARRQQATLAFKERQVVETMEFRTRRIRHVFKQAETHLKETLKSQQARVHELYGSLTASRLTGRKRYRVEWTRIPLTIQIRAQMLNAVKNKLPRGHYVMVATLYDRLGGHALHWSNLLPGTRPHFTQPFEHRGRFYNTKVVVNHDLFVVCPPEIELRPGNALIFELYRLSQATFAAYSRTPRSQRGPTLTDHVVAWGALPLTTSEFQVVEGKFKLPLLRGEVDLSIDKYEVMEKLYQHDLTSWLCNFYFQVYHLSTSHSLLRQRLSRPLSTGNGQFDAEVDEQRELLRLVRPHVETHSSTLRRRANGINDREILEEEDDQVNHRDKNEDRDAFFPSSLLPNDVVYSSKRKTTSPSLFMLSSLPWKRWLARFRPTKKTRVYSGDAFAMEYERNGRLHSENNYDAIRADPSTRFDSFHNTEEQAENDDTIVQTLQTLDVENYTYSLHDAASLATARQDRVQTQRKLRYLRHELMMDFGLAKWQTLEFWRSLALLLLACWLRIYVHYITQWLFLRGSRTPVYDFQPRWTTCIVKYTWENVATHIELGLLSLGVLGNTMLFAFLSAIAAVGQRLVGDLPTLGSLFVFSMGIATVLDPFLVLLVDILSHHYGCSHLRECAVSLTASECSCVTGDWFKLYVRFETQEGSGLVGLFIVLVLYASLTCLSLMGLYIYLLYIHMNGRMLDIYRRVHGHEDSFFLPHDAEIPLQELQTLCAQATRWKGPRGSQRKVFVHDYKLSDPLDPLVEETNTHVAVYNVEINGTRELHRHFLKMADGAILELFGELAVNGDGTREPSYGGASRALLHTILQDVQRGDTC